MVKHALSKFCVAVTILASLCFLYGRERAAGGDISMTQLTETITKIRTGETSSIRTEAAEHLFKVTRGTTRTIDDKTIAEIASLLDSPDDSVRYWIARCLGNFGRRA